MQLARAVRRVERQLEGCEAGPERYDSAANPDAPVASWFDGGSHADPGWRLWSLWREGRQPRVEDFLEQAGVCGPEEIVMALRVDQAERCRLGQWVSAEHYLDAFPAVRDHSESAIDLVFAEFLLREERGEQPPLEEFLRRFPEHADELKLQIELHREMDDHQGPTGSGTAAMLPVEGSTAPADRPTGYPEIAGYEVMGVLGRGGMGIVYRARQTELKRPVAVKMLIAGALASPEAAARFRVEVEAMARLRHPNIVQIYGLGQHAGAPFLVLELVEGRSLAGLTGTPQPADGRTDDGVAAGAGHPRGAPAGRRAPRPLAGQYPHDHRRHTQGLGLRPGQADHRRRVAPEAHR